MLAVRDFPERRPRTWRRLISMTTTAGAQRSATPGRFDSWRTRDILVAAVIGVVFGVVFWVWNNVWAAFAFLQPSVK